MTFSVKSSVGKLRQGKGKTRTTKSVSTPLLPKARPFISVIEPRAKRNLKDRSDSLAILEQSRGLNLNLADRANFLDERSKRM